MTKEGGVKTGSASASTACGAANTRAAGTAAGPILPAVAGRACAPASPDFTKLCKPWDWHLAVPGCERWQQRCALCANICGHERQLPKNSAITTSATISELHRVRI
jgi:hypothetical protein